MTRLKRYFVPAALAASLLVRAAYAAHSGRALIYPDELAYDGAAAKMLAAGSWSGLFHNREPLYSLFLWLIYLPAGPAHIAVKLFQAALSTFSAYLLYRTASGLFGRGPGRIVLLLFAFYPFSIFYDARLLRESLLVFLTVASLYFALKPPSTATTAAASVAAGIAAMAKVVFVYYWAFFMLAGLLLRRIRPAAALAGTAALLAAVSPLLVHNYRGTGSFFLTRGQMFNLYSPLVAPRRLLGTPEENAYIAADRVFAAGMALPEAERDAYFKAKVLEQARTRPWNFAKRTAWRFFKLWRLYPHRGIDYAAGSWALLTAISLLSDGWLIPLGFWGVFALRRRLRELYPAYAYLASMTAIYSLSWSQIRYRLTMMPVLMLFAAPLLAKAAARAGLDFFAEGSKNT